MQSDLASTAARAPPTRAGAAPAAAPATISRVKYNLALQNNQLKRRGSRELSVVKYNFDYLFSINDAAKNKFNKNLISGILSPNARQ